MKRKNNNGHDSPSQSPDKAGTAPPSEELPGLAQRLAWRGLLAALAWWVLSEGQREALPLGAIAVPAAVALSLALTPGSRYTPRPLGLLLFLGFFLRRSCIAGLEVARCILQPRLAIEPFIARVPLSLPAGWPRWLLADTLSLLPGTLSVALEGDVLVLHRLTAGGDIREDVRQVERRVARLFGLAEGSA